VVLGRNNVPFLLKILSDDDRNADFRTLDMKVRSLVFETVRRSSFLRSQGAKLEKVLGPMTRHLETRHLGLKEERPKHLDTPPIVLNLEFRIQIQKFLPTPDLTLKNEAVISQC
jgi:hypothetical protein